MITSSATAQGLAADKERMKLKPTNIKPAYLISKVTSFS